MQKRMHLKLFSNSVSRKKADFLIKLPIPFFITTPFKMHFLTPMFILSLFMQFSCVCQMNFDLKSKATMTHQLPDTVTVNVHTDVTLCSSVAEYLIS